MKFLDTLERHAPWLGFPQLLRMLVMLQAIFFAVFYVKAPAKKLMAFNMDLILSGEVWRLVSHFFICPIPTNPVGVVILLFYISVASMISDSFEQLWSSFRFSIFVYISALSITVACSLSNIANPTEFIAYGGALLYLSSFLLFALMFPQARLNLFGILPMPVWILGLFSVIIGLLYIIQNPSSIVFFLIAFAPLLIIAIPRLLAAAKSSGTSMAHRESFRRKVNVQAGHSLHQCQVCQRTEQDDESLEFRVSANGEEYCTEHLPPNPES